MRIALISSSYHPYPGGVEEHTRNVARELRAVGHRVVVWTVDRGEHLGIRHLEGIEVRYLPTPLPSGSLLGVLRFGARLPHALWRWGSALLALRPKVLHVQCFGPNGVYALLAHHFTRIPLVISAHGETFMDEHDVFSTSRLLRWSLMRSLREASTVTGCSTIVLEDLRHRFGLDGGAVIPNGVDPDEGMPLPQRPIPTPGADGPVRVFALARLVSVKGIDLLIRAFAAADLPTGSLLVIGGDGPELEPLRALARECGVEARCDFLGELDRTAVARQMDEATIAVVPSRIEAFGIVVLEVWRAGTPLIATRNGGPADIVTDEVDGLLVDPEDTGAFAATLVRLAADADLRERLGAAGRRSVTAYTWQRTASDYERIYEAVPTRVGAGRWPRSSHHGGATSR